VSQLGLRRRLYPEFARVGSALGSDKRLEILDLLAQAPRHVDALASEMGLSTASTSQHLQVLRAAKLVEAAREGNRILYRLADDGVLRLWLTLRSVAERNLPEVDRILREYGNAEDKQPVTRDELQTLLAKDALQLIDVRPRIEYESGHLPGALCFPLDELTDRMDELERDRLVVTYCRGIYCLMSNDAEALLQSNGFQVRRLDGGWPEWFDEGRPVAG